MKQTRTAESAVLFAYEDVISENVASKSLFGIESTDKYPVFASIVNIKASPFSFKFPFASNIAPLKDTSMSSP